MRMDLAHFQDLLEMIGPKISKQNTIMRQPISPAERLALWFLPTGETFRSLEFQFRISRKAISYIIVEVVDAIYTTLGKEYLRFPSGPDDWKKIEATFADRWNFPHCIGAIDGKHV